MTHISLALIFLGVAAILNAASKEIFDGQSIEFDVKIKNEIAQLQKNYLNLISRVEKVEKSNQILEEKNQVLEKKNQILEESNQILIKKTRELEEKNIVIDDEIEYLKELSKLKVVRTCEEMADYGVNRSGIYPIDPDGPLLGHKPIFVFCEFKDGVAATKIAHNSEDKTAVDHCIDPGCYSRKIIYDAPMAQIQSLIELSDSCSQDIKYECFLSVLQDNGVNFGFWLDRHGHAQIYWTGDNYGQHVCSCHFSQEGCYSEETLGNTCNCDSNKPSELTDLGTITNTTALPITELRFGGLEFDAQSGFHTLGKLSCVGKKTVESRPDSCSSLKKDGYFKNGFFNVKPDGDFSKLLFCNMSVPGYDVTDEFIDSSEGHFVDVETKIDEIEANINEIEKNVDEIEVTVQETGEMLEDISKPILFSAYINSPKVYNNGDYLDSYDGFLTEYGSSFSLTSGTFNAQRDGVYSFSASAYHYDQRSNHLSVMKNSQKELEFRSYESNDNDDTLTFSWMMELEAEDNVRLKVSAGRFDCNSAFNCIFSGKFVREK